MSMSYTTTYDKTKTTIMMDDNIGYILGRISFINMLQKVLLVK